MKVKKVPIRKCVGCGENKPKRELIRIVKNKDNEIFIKMLALGRCKPDVISVKVHCNYQLHPLLGLYAL